MKRKNRGRNRRTAGLFCLLILAAVFLAGSPVSAKGELPDTLTNRTAAEFNDANGLPSSEVNAIVQTGDGYIWIGSYGGLIRYDGKRFQNLSGENNRIHGMGIRSLFEDKEGRLWIGTNENGIFLYEKEKNDFVPLTTEKKNTAGSVRCFAQDRKGRIYAGFSDGLYVMEESGRLREVEINELEGQAVYTLSADKNDVLWGTAGEGSLFAVRNGKLLYKKDPGSLSEFGFYSVLAGADGVIYAGTSGNELLTLTQKGEGYTDSSFRVKTYQTKDIRTINSLYQNGDGELWLCSDTGAAYFTAGMRFTIPDVLNGKTFISAAAEDYEGSMWLASSKFGVFRLMAGKFYSTGKKEGLESHIINASVSMGGRYYFAADDGLFITDGRFGRIENALTERLGDLRIRHLMDDGNGGLWISTYGEGLFCFYPETGKITSWTEKTGLSGDYVRSTLKRKDGSVAVATGNGLQIIKDGKIAETYGVKEGLSNSVILCMCEEKDGTLLAGSDGTGIYAVRNGKIKNYGQKEGLSAGSVLRMVSDPEEKGVWISAGSSLFFMTDHKIRKIEEIDTGIGSIFDIIIQEKTIWLLKGDGVLAAPKKDLLAGRTVIAPRYGKESGMCGNITANSRSFIKGDILCICTVNGPAFFDTKFDPSDTVPPKTAVSEITAEDSEGRVTVYANPGEITIPDNTRRLTVKFASLAFSSGSIRLLYYLEGFDETPVSVSASETGEVSYTNLKGGDYVFHLRAQTGDGVEGAKEIRVTVRKELGFWEHRNVRIAVILLAILVAAVGIEIYMDLKLKKEKRRRQEYKEITEQAMRTIANTIDAKDPYTNGHSLRVAQYSRELARRLRMSEGDQERIYYIALMHDIGKIGIPDNILNKPEELTDEEFEIIKRHPSIGGEILKDFTALPGIGDGARYHHERYDGSGYNEGLKEDAIPYYARIIGVADAYDAMRVSRVYRKSLTREAILAELKKQAGKQFDETIVKAAIGMIEDGFAPEIQRKKRI